MACIRRALSGDLDGASCDALHADRAYLATVPVMIARLDLITWCSELGSCSLERSLSTRNMILIVDDIRVSTITVIIHLSVKDGRAQVR